MFYLPYISNQRVACLTMGAGLMIRVRHSELLKLKHLAKKKKICRATELGHFAQSFNVLLLLTTPISGALSLK